MFILAYQHGQLIAPLIAEFTVPHLFVALYAVAALVLYHAE
jgi:hypothetical protein